MVIFMLLYKVCLIQAHCVLCSCIVFKLIVYGRVHVLYSSSLYCVWSCSCIVLKLIIYGRVPLLYSGSLCKVVFMYCIYSGSLCMVMCVFMLFA